MDALALAHDIEELPPDKQKEIADFVAFLHEQSRAEDKDSVSDPVVRSPSDSMSSENEGVFGMWADRQDMKDGVSWVRDLRERMWGSRYA